MEQMLILVDAKQIPERDVMQFRNEFLNAGEHSINGSRGLHNYDNYNDWIWLVKECEKPDNHLLGVQANTYFAIRENDGKIVGCIELRTSLNDKLRKIGGHIGYSVLSAERRKGYATEMLHLILIEAEKIGLSKVLLTCDVNNLGSIKTIEDNGGMLERQEPFTCGDELYYKYWINCVMDREA